jgi:hypothetical protein
MQALIQRGYTFRRTAPEAPAAPADPRFQTGGRFTGSDIRSAPRGSRIRGLGSGRDYEVTEDGIQSDDGVYYSFDTIETHNREFETLAASAQAAANIPASGVRPGQRLGATDLSQVPTGHYVRSSSGTVYEMRRGYMVSQATGRRTSLRTGRLAQSYTYLGEDQNARPAAVGDAPAPGRQAMPYVVPTTDVPLAESQGYRRVTQDEIEAFDRPRPRPTPFNTEDTTPLADYLRTSAGRMDLQLTLESALPEGSVVNVSPSGAGFSASYSTPDGDTGSMSRSISRGGRRVSNDVAHGGGGNFEHVQDALFSFYRQHGIREVEVHGLTSGSMNGAHTWIRRGFRPDPSYLNRGPGGDPGNIGYFQRLNSNLKNVIQATEQGRYPQYEEFLDEARELARRADKLLRDRANMRAEQVAEELYQLWRAITYLGEVRNGNGNARRGDNMSIGWRLLGRGMGSYWYWGLRNIENYFEE